MTRGLRWSSTDVVRPAYAVVLARQIARAGLPKPVLEFKFHPTRKWRIDLAYPDIKLAIEVEGMVHRTRERFMGDIEKYNELTLMGWRLLRVYTRWICGQRESDAAVKIVARALAEREL